MSLTLADVIGASSEKYCHAYAAMCGPGQCRRKYRKRIILLIPHNLCGDTIYTMGIGNQLASLGRGVQTFNMKTVYLTSALVGIAGLLLIVYNPQRDTAVTRDTQAPGKPKSQIARLCGVFLVVLAMFTVPITRYQYHAAHTSKTYAEVGGAAFIL